MPRMFQGPKDMPHALRSYLLRGAGGVQLAPWEEEDISLVWCSRDVCLQAAEAAVDMPLNDDTFRAMKANHARMFGQNVCLFMFPARTLPALTWGSKNRIFTEDVRGFLVDMYAYTTNTYPYIIPVVESTPGTLSSMTAISIRAEQWAEVTLAPKSPQERDEMLSLLAQLGASPESAANTLDHFSSAMIRGGLTAEQIGRFVTAVFALINEPGVTSSSMVRAGKKDAHPVTGQLPEIRRIELRPMKYVNQTHSTSGRVYTHRWVVRGHWRQQFYASTGTNAPRWIAPYIKGKEGAPLLTNPKVYVWNR